MKIIIKDIRDLNKQNYNKYITSRRPANTTFTVAVLHWHAYIHTLHRIDTPRAF